MGTAAFGGVCSTSAKTTKAMPMRTSMTRKKRMRKGRQSLRGMHFGIAAAGCGGRKPGLGRLVSGGCELCQHSTERPRSVVADPVRHLREADDRTLREAQPEAMGNRTWRGDGDWRSGRYTAMMVYACVAAPRPSHADLRIHTGLRQKGLQLHCCYCGSDATAGSMKRCQQNIQYSCADGGGGPASRRTLPTSDPIPQTPNEWRPIQQSRPQLPGYSP